MLNRECEPPLQTFYLYCSEHGFLGSVCGMEDAIEIQEDHYEAGGDGCDITISTTQPLNGGDDI